MSFPWPLPGLLQTDLHCDQPSLRCRSRPWKYPSTNSPSWYRHSQKSSCLDHSSFLNGSAGIRLSRIPAFLTWSVDRNNREHRKHQNGNNTSSSFLLPASRGENGAVLALDLLDCEDASPHERFCVQIEAFSGASFSGATLGRIFSASFLQAFPRTVLQAFLQAFCRLCCALNCRFALRTAKTEEKLLRCSLQRSY